MVLEALIQVSLSHRKGQVLSQTIFKLLFEFFKLTLCFVFAYVGPGALDRRHSPIVNGLNVLLNKSYPDWSVHMLIVNLLGLHLV